jgi:hypothetical protein
MTKDRDGLLQIEVVDNVRSSGRSLRLEREVSELRVDLTPPRLIRIVGTTRNGEVIERHIKITEKQKMLMV